VPGRWAGAGALRAKHFAISSRQNRPREVRGRYDYAFSDRPAGPRDSNSVSKRLEFPEVSASADGSEAWCDRLRRAADDWLAQRTAAWTLSLQDRSAPACIDRPSPLGAWIAARETEAANDKG